MDRQEADACTYRVTRSEHGFLARCRDLELGREGHTVSIAVAALRSAIAANRQAKEA
jgi:hypothetical protein